MSARITRKNLYQQLAVLNRITEASHDLNYGLEIWSPGDGWTRYQLIGPRGNERSRVCTLSEMYEVLYTLIRVLSIDMAR